MNVNWNHIDIVAQKRRSCLVKSRQQRERNIKCS